MWGHIWCLARWSRFLGPTWILRSTLGVHEHKWKIHYPQSVPQIPLWVPSALTLCCSPCSPH